MTEPQFRQDTPIYQPFSASADVKCRRVSQPLQRVITDFGADHPFRQIPAKLQEHYGIDIPHETARCITESHGLDALESQISEEARPSKPGGDCIVVEQRFRAILKVKPAPS